MSEKNSGIYYIQNTVTKQLYIGQTSNLHKREIKHFSMLRNNSHFNNHLQRSFNKYGQENFKFGVIEYCDKSNLLQFEKEYVDFYNAKEHGFNINDGGDATPDNRGENNGMYGREAPNRRKDLEDKLDEICEKYESGKPLSHLAKEYNTNRKIIREKLRMKYSKEEMAIINKKNQKSPDIIRKGPLGKKFSLSQDIKLSKLKTTSGYFRVSKDGDYWIYKWYDENNKRRKLSSGNIPTLKRKVISKGLDWVVIDEELAKHSLNKFSDNSENINTLD